MLEALIHNLMGCDSLARKILKLWEEVPDRWNCRRYWIIVFQRIHIAAALSINFCSVFPKRATCWIFTSTLWHLSCAKDNLVSLLPLCLVLPYLVLLLQLYCTADRCLLTHLGLCDRQKFIIIIIIIYSKKLL